MSHQPFPPPSRSGRLPQCRQAGSILVQFALLSAVILSILAAVQIGYMYYAKRDLQRIADLAALEAVNALTHGDSSTCNRAQTAGDRSVTEQLHIALDDTERRIECGNWNASRADAQRFNLSHGGANPLNATRVHLQGQTLQLLPLLGDRTISAEAIASKNSEPIAAFSVGSQLLNFNNNAILGKILSGVGLDLSTLTVLDSDGVLNASISPSGLLQAIGNTLGIQELIALDLAALTPEEIAKLPKVGIADIVKASASVVGKDTLQALVDLADAIKAEAKIDDIKIPLIGKPGEGSVFAFLGLGSNNSPIGAAADLQIGLSEVLKTAVAIGANGHAASLDLSLLGDTIKTSLTIVEPPAIGIGPVGTKAYTAQIRLNLRVDTNELPALGPLLGSTLVRLDLPIAIDLVTAQGELKKISCESTPHTVDIFVDSTVGDICIGNINTKYPGRCSETLSKANAINLKLVLIPLLEVKIKSFIPLLSAEDETFYDFSVYEEPRHTKPNDILPKNTVEKLIEELDVEANLLGLLPLGPLVDGTVKPILKIVLVNLLGDPLDGIGKLLLSPILQDLLGLELGKNEVDVLAIQCDTAQLVQ